MSALDIGKSHAASSTDNVLTRPQSYTRPWGNTWTNGALFPGWIGLKSGPWVVGAKSKVVIHFRQQPDILEIHWQLTLWCCPVLGRLFSVSTVDVSTGCFKTDLRAKGEHCQSKSIWTLSCQNGVFFPLVYKAIEKPNIYPMMTKKHLSKFLRTCLLVLLIVLIILFSFRD